MSQPFRLITVLVASCDIALNPRSTRDPAYCRSIGENMKAVGQQVPVIGYFEGDRFQVVEGGCRLEGARLVGLTELLAMDLGKKPTPADLQMALASIDVHRQHLPPVDRARLWQSIMRERGCTARQFAKDLAISESLVSKSALLLTLAPDLQEQVNAGALEFSKACLIAQKSPDHAAQRELAAAMKGLSRKQMAAKLRQRRDGQAEAVKTSTLKIVLVGGVTVIVKGADLTLALAGEWLDKASKEVEKAKAQGLNSRTAERVWRERSKAKAGSKP